MHWITQRWLIPGAVAFWAVLAGISLERSLAGLDHHAATIATERSRMLFTLIETARLWNASHGGLYAPMTEETPANEWLDDPERDIVVNGKPYTKINPAYMTRQLAALFAAQGEIRLNLTSLKPIRPANRADAWETKALRLFETGKRELTELIDNGSGEPAFRYMAALLARAPCLTCHASQGYKLGDVRGGISVTIPARLIAAEVAPQRRNAILLHANVFLILALFSVIALRHVQSSWRRLAAAKAEQDSLVAERTAHLSTANQALNAEMAERQRVAAKLEQTVGELRRSNTELEQFAYVVSHDLQEPLRMVTGYAQLLNRRHAAALDGDAKDFLGFMVEGAQRMNAMIADLLAYSRVQRQQPTLNEEDGDRLLGGALDNLRAAIGESGAVISHDAMPVLRVDGSQVLRLFQNLIGNAIKYRSPERSPRIHIGVARAGDDWHFTIQDNGIGIAPQFFDRLFMVFQRLHSRGEYPGNGIGLAVCKTIVERHGGRIWVDSTPGDGSTFHFTLPAEPP